MPCARSWSSFPPLQSFDRSESSGENWRRSQSSSIVEHPERHLAAILSADVAGYSRLMGADEEATVTALSAARASVERILPTHRGRLVDFTGDNFLAEFPTATEALACAMEIQRSLAERNTSLPSERRMEFRIGIHLGEVRAEGERIYGNGVNVASRLEGLAEPGGICVSQIVRSQVRDKFALAFEDLGERPVKNIAEPVRVYRVRADGQRAEPPRHAAPRRRLLTGTAAVVLVVALCAGGWWLFGRRPASVVSGTGSESAPGVGIPAARPIGTAFGGRPAIAVLPFENLSDDPEQEYFADGIAEDLITRLSLWRSFPVIARNSSFVYKGKAVDVKQVSADLGVRYVIEGSVRKAADRVRISAQVVDAETGHHVWANTYDRDLKDIFAVQDEITTAIAGAMFPELLQSESVRALRKEPADLNAWDLVQRARWHLWSGNPAQNEKAKALAARAVEIDPYFTEGYAVLSMALYGEVVSQLTETPDRSAEEMLRMARKSLELDANSPVGHAALALALSLTGEREEMRATAEQLLELEPSSAYGYWWLALALSGSPGTADDSVELVTRGMRLSPHDPMTWAFYDTLATAHRTMGRYGEAVAALRRVVQLRPSYAWGHLALASDYANLGQLDEARAALQEALRRQPGLSVQLARKAYSFTDPEVMDRYLDGLRKAGWEG
jgi:adenylate cyclase